MSKLTEKELSPILLLKDNYSKQAELVERLDSEDDKDLRKLIKSDLKSVKKYIKIYEKKVLAILWETSVKSNIPLIEQVKKDEGHKNESGIPTR